MLNRSFITGIILLACNSLGITYLIISQHAHTQSANDAHLSAAQLEQLDKLYKLAIQFRTELEQVASRAAYPSDKERFEANEYLQNHLMAMQLVRLELSRAKQTRTTQAGEQFLKVAWGDYAFLSTATAVFDVQKYRFAKYNSATEQFVPYNNVNLSRLESISNEFKVLALSFVKDLAQ